MTRCWREIGTGGLATCERLAEVVHCRNCAEYSRAGRELFDRPVSTQLLDESTAGLAAKKDRARHKAVSVVIFRLNAEWFALPTALFAEVAEQHAPHTVPFRTGGAFLGLVNVNGELLLCVSLAHLLGIDGPGGAEPVRPRLSVIAKDRERVAFFMDEVLGVRRVEETSLEPPPSTVAKAPEALTASLFRYDGRSIALLDEDKLFSTLARCLAW